MSHCPVRYCDGGQQRAQPLWSKYWPLVQVVWHVAPGLVWQIELVQIPLSQSVPVAQGCQSGFLAAWVGALGFKAVGFAVVGVGVVVVVVATGSVVVGATGFEVVGFAVVGTSGTHRTPVAV